MRKKLRKRIICCFAAASIMLSSVTSSMTAFSENDSSVNQVVQTATSGDATKVPDEESDVQDNQNTDNTEANTNEAATDNTTQDTTQNTTENTIENQDVDKDTEPDNNENQNETQNDNDENNNDENDDTTLDDNDSEIKQNDEYDNNENDVNDGKTPSNENDNAQNDDKNTTGSEIKLGETNLYSVLSEKLGDVKLTVFSSSMDSNVGIKTAAVDTDREGLEIIKGYVISKNNIDKSDDSDASKQSDGTVVSSNNETLWVKVEPGSGFSVDPDDRVALYSVDNKVAKDVIIEDISEVKTEGTINNDSDDAPEESGIYELNKDVTGIALVKDTGYRHINIELRPETEDTDSAFLNNSINEDLENNSDLIKKIIKKDNSEEIVEAPKESGEDENKDTAGNEINTKNDKDNKNSKDSKDSKDNKDSKVSKDNNSKNDQDDKKKQSGKNSEKEQAVDIESKVMLDGIMPTDASAEAVDVTELYQKNEESTADTSTIAAFDITIKNGDDEYQPDETRPIKVEITDSRINESDDLQLWHIKDDGEKEEVTDFTAEDGKVSFDADGFSVYQIVTNAIQNGSNSDKYKLNGKKYGLMYYNDGTYGYALMAGDDNVHALVEAVTHPKSSTSNGVTIYVDMGSEVTKWEFHSAGQDNYKLSGMTDKGTKYLSVAGDKLVLVDSADDAVSFKVVPDSNKKKIQLVSDNNKYVTLSSRQDEDDETYYYYSLSDTPSDKSWLYFVDNSNATDNNLILFSADRISVSDATNGQKVIVYTRVWNSTDLKYETYAIGPDGVLYPCYSSGGELRWLGDGSIPLEWVFTEYYDKVTKKPNYYYELYSPYSKMYFAPQLYHEQALSKTKVGITLPGRRNGDYYSRVLAWDTPRYSYAGLKVVEEDYTDAQGKSQKRKVLAPCTESSESIMTFYFATLEPLNTGSTLHTVDTIDNADYGITMKMVDFTGTGNTSGAGATQQNGYLKKYDYNPTNTTPGLLSTHLNLTGYPTAIKSNKDLSGLYAGAQDVNHLFIEKVYNTSGYFEFDSTQYFATLKASNDGNFTVYRELGTSGDQDKKTLKHGQFLPYDNIEAGKYSTANPVNEYCADAKPTPLDEKEPRKYEKLFSAGKKLDLNYYFGMEMSARFVQTLKGVDAWGHDIIFEFSGDDDFWLYVDGELVIDLGGVHSALGGSVNFRTGAVKVNGEDKELRQIFIDNYKARYKKEHNNANPSIDEIKAYLLNYFEPDPSDEYGCEKVFADYSAHDMKLFYMERGAGASNLHMKFNIASVTPGQVVVSKTLSGNDADYIDKELVEYPFQIWYETEDDPDHPKLLGNEISDDPVNNHIWVNYQNSTQSVRYAQLYRPPGVSEENAYRNVYFLNPTKNAEITFPENTIKYKLVECAVDTSIYGEVKINGATVPSNHIETNGSYRSYESDLVTAEDRPVITFDNKVNDNVIKDLKIKKELVDENNQAVHDDTSTFSFRLRLSSVDMDPNDLPLTNMYPYYIVSPNGKICKRDFETQKFVETDLEYSRDNIDKIKNGEVAGLTVVNTEFKTSGLGAISEIPIDYTIVVPGIPPGSIFKVTEDVKPGYGVKEYHREDGLIVDENGHQHEIESYDYYYDNGPYNVGIVRIDTDPILKVINQKGFGLSVYKNWSDLDITTSHDPIYVAVYVDGSDSILADSLKQIGSATTSAYYFWPKLENKADGTTRTDMSGYVVKEVKITSGTPQVDEEGNVTNYNDLTVEPLNDDDEVQINATPTGKSQGEDFTYVVSYDQGTEKDKIRTDNITNTRRGAIAIRLFKWNSEVPLKGGIFTLSNSSGKVIDTYTSDADGIVKMLYDFERGKKYILKETFAPDNYVGLQKKLSFIVNDDYSVSLFYEDGTTEWGSTETADKDWANSKAGSGAITAYIDIYNKPFDLKIVKTDSNNSSIKLGSAHFALYEQTTPTINGYGKSADPMTGFEDMMTVNGEVTICGGNSGRALKPDENGTVYYLTETKAPRNYKAINKDIVFKMSALGVPVLLEGDDVGTLAQSETEDSYVYTIDIPNEKIDPNLVLLTITKTVTGNMGNKTKDFDFTVKVVAPEGGSANSYPWTKNGEDQANNMEDGENTNFTMQHGDAVAILVPKGVTVTVSEESQGYKSSFKVGTDDPEEVDSKTITINDDTNLEVINELTGDIPTGVETSLMLLITSFFGIIIVLALIILNNRRLKKERNL